jgi:hypothetical protein
MYREEQYGDPLSKNHKRETNLRKCNRVNVSKVYVEIQQSIVQLINSKKCQHVLKQQAERWIENSYFIEFAEALVEASRRDHGN